MSDLETSSWCAANGNASSDADYAAELRQRALKYCDAGNWIVHPMPPWLHQECITHGILHQVKQLRWFVT